MAKQVTKNSKRLQGEVLNVSGTNTIRVLVETKYHHPLYKKIIKEHKRYLVNCTDTEVKAGDKVQIQEGKPMSSRKSFYFVKKIS